MKVRYGQGIFGAFVFHKVPALEYGRDIPVDNNIFLFLDDDDIDPQGLPGKGMFDVKVQRIGIGQQFQADGITKGGVPGDAFMTKIERRFTVVADRMPPDATVDYELRPCKGLYKEQRAGRKV
jgi:hypothetical protein